MRTNADLTIYNRYIDTETRTEKYQRGAVVGVAWEDRKAANSLATGGNIAADQARVFIPFQRGLNHVKGREWQNLSYKTGRWTLQVGDVIVRGLILDEIGDGFTLSMLKAKYDDVLVISSIDSMDSGSGAMRHWQVGAK